MATKKPKETKPVVYPEVDPELYKIMRGVYDRWTGYQLADVIAKIRREIEEAKVKADLQADLAVIQSKLEILDGPKD